MGTVGTVTQNPKNTIRRDKGETTTTAPKASGTGTSTIPQNIPTLYQATHYELTLPEPMRTVATSMSKITPETQRKNAGEIFNLLNT